MPSHTTPHCGATHARRGPWTRALQWSLRGTLLAATLLMAGCPQSFFYNPDTVLYSTPREAGLKFEQAVFASSDNTRLTGWFIPAEGSGAGRGAKGTVVHFHGYRQNMSQSWRNVAWLARRGFNVFVFDYRGYGSSSGSPATRAIYQDSLAALRHVRARLDVDASRLLVFGQSLGGNPAIAAVGADDGVQGPLAGRAGVRAVAVESTFYSYSSIAGEKVRMARRMVSDDLSAAQHIGNIAPIPLLLIYGTGDTSIPYEHGERLYAQAHQPKRLITVPGGEHMESMEPEFGDTYRDQLVAFFENALAKPG